MVSISVRIPKKIPNPSTTFMPAPATDIPHKSPVASDRAVLVSGGNGRQVAVAQPDLRRIFFAILIILFVFYAFFLFDAVHRFFH